MTYTYQIWHLQNGLQFNDPWLTFLVGGFNPFEKYYIVKLEIFPKYGMKIKNIWNHHLDFS